MKATITDVAKRAKTSAATVSRYLNGTGRVSSSLVVAIDKAISDLNYTPHRSHSRKKTNTVGIIFPDLDNLYYITVIKGLEHRLAEKNYNLLICTSKRSVDQEKRIISNFVQRGVEGIILLGTRPISGDNQHIITLNETLPVLTINDRIFGSNISSLIVDEADGSYKAIDYLLKLGHRRIAFVNGELNCTTYRYKYIGYEKALHDSNTKINPDYYILQEHHETGGYQGALKLLQMAKPPTAIFCANDQMALGVIKAAHEKGVGVPSDLSVIGFSNTPISTAISPELTTIDQFPYTTGCVAANMIVKQIKKTIKQQEFRVLGTKLIERESCLSIKSI